jgi:hypothetical protein
MAERFIEGRDARGGVYAVIARQFLAAGAGYLVAKGVLQQAQIDLFIGGGMLAVSAGFGVASYYLTRKELVEALEECHNSRLTLEQCLLRLSPRDAEVLTGRKPEPPEDE